jgi:aspartyl-tRNA(Asn)/glutamyl-tRNA(Gln) amidotransferase subunit A
MPAVARNFNAALGVLATFCDLVPGVQLPDMPYGAAVGTIVNAEGAAAFRDLIESGRSRELQQKDDRTGGYVAYATPAVDYIDAQRQRTLMNRAVHDAFGAYDAVLSPTIPTVTYPIGQPFDKTYTEYGNALELISCGNLAGLPALALPNGFGDHGLPTSIALMGTAFNETRLTAIGKRYQSLTAFHRRRPPLVTTVRA